MRISVDELWYRLRPRTLRPDEPVWAITTKSTNFDCHYTLTEKLETYASVFWKRCLVARPHRVVAVHGSIFRPRAITLADLLALKGVTADCWVTFTDPDAKTLLQCVRLHPLQHAFCVHPKIAVESTL